MASRSIPVVSREEFERLATRDPDLLHTHPWVVSGYIEHWPEYRQWQELDHLRERFGHLGAFAKAPNFVTNRKASLVSVETTFAQYLDYIAEPDRVREIYDGCWLDGDYEQFAAQELPLYCGTLRFAHHAEDPVFAALDPLVPAPLQPWNHALPYYYSLFNHLWLLVSLPGALTPLHTDNNGTIALIAQLRGRKRAILYSPDDLRHVHNPDVGYLDPLAPDDADFPTWRSAVEWRADLDVGQVLFVGTNWGHHVQTLEASISVSFDFVDQTNIAAYAASTAWAQVLGDRVKRRPDLIVAKIPDALTSTQIETLSPVEVGRRVMAYVLRASIADANAADKAPIRKRYLTHLEQCLALRDQVAA